MAKSTAATGVPLSDTIMRAAGGTETADRVADVLLLIARSSRPVGVSEAARRLGVSKAVVHRMLQSLVSRDLVEPEPLGAHGYRLGHTMVAIGARALRESDIRRVSRDILTELRDKTGETATVSVLTGTSRAYVDQCTSAREIKMTVELGTPYPLHAGATGKAILAFMASDARDRILNGHLPRSTQATVVDVHALRRELDEIHQHQVATSRGERQGETGAVATPVFGLDGQVAGAISICGPVGRFDSGFCASVAPDVLAAGRAASDLLGYRLGGDPTTDER